MFSRGYQVSLWACWHPGLSVQRTSEISSSPAAIFFSRVAEKGFIKVWRGAEGYGRVWRCRVRLDGNERWTPVKDSQPVSLLEGLGHFVSRRKTWMWSLHLKHKLMRKKTFKRRPNLVIKNFKNKIISVSGMATFHIGAGPYMSKVLCLYILYRSGCT